jgi:hypothetical protein
VCAQVGVFLYRDGFLDSLCLLVVGDCQPDGITACRGKEYLSVGKSTEPVIFIFQNKIRSLSMFMDREEFEKSGIKTSYDEYHCKR